MLILVMSFFEAITICFRKYATFSGRATRSEFWYFVLFYVICLIIAPIMDLFLFNTVFGMFYWIVYIVTLLPYFAVWVRRLHDINRSGWWTIPIMITSMIIVGTIWFIIWGCKKSVADNNNY